MSHGLGPANDPLGRWARSVPSALAHFSAEGWTQGCVRRRGIISKGPLLARFAFVLRVFQRRQRRRFGRKPSDGLDGAGGQINRAERRITAARATRLEPFRSP